MLHWMLRLELDLPAYPHGAASTVEDKGVEEVGTVLRCNVLICRRSVEVLIVCDVEELAAKLESDALCNLEGLQDIGIEVEVAGGVVGVASFNERAGGRVGR